MKRFGWVTEVRSDKLDEYVRLHADVWPGVADMIRECNIRNYSIYLKDGTWLANEDTVEEALEEARHVVKAWLNGATWAHTAVEAGRGHLI